MRTRGRYLFFVFDEVAGQIREAIEEIPLYDGIGGLAAVDRHKPAPQDDLQARIDNENAEIDAIDEVIERRGKA